MSAQYEEWEKRSKPLVDEYSAWLKANKLPELSADEQDTEGWTPEQKTWLANFIERWETLEHEVWG